MRSFTPMKRVGGRSLSYPEGGGGGAQSFGVVFMWQLEIIAILNGGGGGNKFPLFKGGGGHNKFYPVLIKD